MCTRTGANVHRRHELLHVRDLALLALQQVGQALFALPQQLCRRQHWQEQLARQQRGGDVGGRQPAFREGVVVVCGGGGGERLARPPGLELHQTGGATVNQTREIALEIDAPAEGEASDTSAEVQAETVVVPGRLPHQHPTSMGRGACQATAAAWGVALAGQRVPSGARVSWRCPRARPRRDERRAERHPSACSG